MRADVLRIRPLRSLATSPSSDWFVGLASFAAAFAVAAFNVVTWPAVDAPSGSAVAPGFIVTVDREAEPSIVRYGFELPTGTRRFDDAVVGVDVNPRFGWERHNGGDTIIVAFDPANPADNVPYFEFPAWATASWASMAGILTFTFLYWARGRLRIRHERQQDARRAVDG